MNIKQFLRDWYAKRTGRKCISCAHSCGGPCCHPDGNMFMRCFNSITRPGFEERQAVEGPVPGDMTPEEKYELGKIVETLQEASATAKDGGLLSDRDEVWG